MWMILCVQCSCTIISYYVVMISSLSLRLSAVIDYRLYITSYHRYYYIMEMELWNWHYFIIAYDELYSYTIHGERCCCILYSFFIYLNSQNTHFYSGFFLFVGFCPRHPRHTPHFHSITKWHPMCVWKYSRRYYFELIGHVMVEGNGVYIYGYGHGYGYYGHWIFDLCIHLVFNPQNWGNRCG